jgi:hypothetical protein
MFFEWIMMTVMALDPRASQFDLRSVIRKVPESKEFIVGTSSGEDPFTFDVDWLEPAQPEPEVFTFGDDLRWSDSFHLKRSSFMQIAEKRIEFSCALLQGRQLRKTAPSDLPLEEHFLIEVYLYQKHWRCQTGHEYDSHPQWLRFIFRTDSPKEMIGLEFAHLFNHFHAVPKSKRD